MKGGKRFTHRIDAELEQLLTEYRRAERDIPSMTVAINRLLRKALKAEDGAA